MYYYLSLEAKEINDNRFFSETEAVNEALRASEKLGAAIKIFEVREGLKQGGGVLFAIAYPDGSLKKGTEENLSVVMSKVVKELLHRGNKNLAKDVNNIKKEISK